jgi:hypothetical protein
MMMLIALAAPGDMAKRLKTAPSPDAVPLLRGLDPASPLQAALATAGTQSATNLCINFTGVDADPLIAGEVWELRYASCAGSECSIIMARPEHPFIEDYHSKRSIGTVGPEPPGIAFNWQGMSNDVTGEGALALESHWDARSCRVFPTIPNHGGQGAIGHAGAFFLSADPDASQPITLTNPNRVACHLDLCSSFRYE